MISKLCLQIKYATSLSSQESEYVLNGLAQQAFEARALAPIENFCISIYQQNTLIGTVVGVILYGAMHVDTLFVDIDFRRQNIGSTLMEKAEELAKSKDCKFITLNTMCWEARGFYEKLGYALEYERSGYAGGSVLYALKKLLSRR